MKSLKKVYIEITNICNKDCSFCSKTKRIKKEMSPYNFSIAISQIKKYTNYIYLHVKGEPLIHSKFKEIIDICDKENMHVNITTNGSLLYKNKEIIINSKSIRQINISLHSYNNTQITELYETVKELNEKTNIYFVYRYWTMKKGEKINKYLESLLEFYCLGDTFRKKLISVNNIKICDNLFINKGNEFIWPSLDNNIYDLKGRCYGLKSHFGILSDGTVIPCCLDAEGIIDLGNIFNESLDSIFQKEKTRKIIKGFQENKKVEELCRHCNFIE